jgi:hypothetical protein
MRTLASTKVSPSSVGAKVGEYVGVAVGDKVGAVVGAALGTGVSTVGKLVGYHVGFSVGVLVEHVTATPLPSKMATDACVQHFVTDEAWHHRQPDSNGHSSCVTSQ